MSNVADVEHALSAPLINAEAIYRANLDMKGFHQEVVRVVLLDAQHRCITRGEIARGTVNESLARPRGRLRRRDTQCRTMLAFGQSGLEIGHGDMVWASLVTAPLQEESIAQPQDHSED